MVEYVGTAAHACEAIWRAGQEIDLIATDQRPDHDPHSVSDQSIYTPQLDGAEGSTNIITSDTGDSPGTLISGEKVSRYVNKPAVVRWIFF